MLFMFLVGLELDPKLIRGQGKAAIGIGSVGLVCRQPSGRCRIGSHPHAGDKPHRASPMPWYFCPVHGRGHEHHRLSSAGAVPDRAKFAQDAVRRAGAMTCSPPSTTCWDGASWRSLLALAHAKGFGDDGRRPFQRLGALSAPWNGPVFVSFDAPR